MTSLESLITGTNSAIGLNERINTITNSLSRPYFGKILQKLAQNNTESATTLCDYIQVEQTEFNIKDSTKEGKIKVLVWLSNYFGDEISFKDMKKRDILDYLNNLRKSGNNDPT